MALYAIRRAVGDVERERDRLAAEGADPLTRFARLGGCRTVCEDDANTSPQVIEGARKRRSLELRGDVLRQMAREIIDEGSHGRQ